MVHKPIFDGLLHTGKPDLAALYGMKYIPMATQRNLPGWTDPQGLPSDTWFNAASAIPTPANILLVDHEAWPYVTQADRRATAGKYVALYAGLIARERHANGS